MRFRGIVLLCALIVPAAADEGMWLFNRFPKAQVKEKYGVEVTDEFLDHLRLSTVRIGGGTGAFVSPNGLILTTYHVVSARFGKVAEAEHESKCPGMEANVLLDQN